MSSQVAFEKDNKLNSDKQSLSQDSQLSDDYLRQQIGDDHVLARKMVKINGAINEIGFTTFHAKLFCLNGFGYAVDSLLVVNQSIAQQSVRREFAGEGVTRLLAVSLSSAVGLLAGALFWGVFGDLIGMKLRSSLSLADDACAGRKLAFNTSLFFCAVFVIIASAPSTLSSSHSLT
ncbi:Hypothetical predicted protein, partial [Olea europaea subsp. europaea]